MMIMIVIVIGLLQTNLSGLHGVGYKEGNIISGSPSLSSTQRRVPSGHVTESWVFYIHNPTVRPKYIVRLSGYPLIQDSLNLHDYTLQVCIASKANSSLCTSSGEFFYILQSNSSIPVFTLHMFIPIENLTYIVINHQKVGDCKCI